MQPALQQQEAFLFWDTLPCVLRNTRICHCLVQTSLVHSHWSRNVEAWLSLVERIIVLLRQLCYAIKNQLASKAPYQGLWNAKQLLAGSLWHKDRWLPCTERSYYSHPYAIKKPARSKQNTPIGVFSVPKPLVGAFGCDELVLYGIRELAPAISRT